MLFDDLPETEKGGEQKKTNNGKQDSAVVNGITPVGDQKQQQQHQVTVPVTQAEHPNANVATEKKANSKSIVESLGSAGTTMAFLPATLRNKRKAAVSVGGYSSGSKSKSAPGSSKQMQIQLQTRRKNSASIIQVPVPVSVHSQAKEINVANANGNSNNSSRSRKDSENAIEKLEGPPEPDNLAKEEDEYTEPQELTDLHASIRSADMYDPMMPNDYLAYKQRKHNESMQKTLQEQAEKTREMQKKLREQIDMEWKKNLASGDLDKIVESDGLGRGLGRGRGRGRGVSNLPAWLIKKQQEQGRSVP